MKKVSTTLFGRPSKVLHITLSTVIASVMGGVLGWILGYFLGIGIEEFIERVPIFSLDDFNQVRKGFNDWGLLLVFLGAFTPLPYKVIAISSGASGVPLIIFIIGLPRSDNPHKATFTGLDTDVAILNFLGLIGLPKSYVN